MKYKLSFEEPFLEDSEFELDDELFEFADLLETYSVEDESEEEFRVSDLPPKVKEAYKLGALGWMLAVQRAIESGISDLNFLTNMAFFMHHPERIREGKGRALSAGEPQFNTLRDEWKAFQNLIKPLLTYRSQQTKPTSILGEPGRPIPAYKDPKAHEKLAIYLPKSVKLLEERKRSRNEERALCLLRKMRQADVNDEFLNKDSAYSWWRENHQRVIYSIDKSTTRLRNALLSDAKWSKTVEQFIQKAIENVKSIDAGIDEVYRIASITSDERGNKSILLKHWLVNRLRDPRSIYHCYPHK
jgi:hypothetical protein